MGETINGWYVWQTFSDGRPAAWNAQRRAPAGWVPNAAGGQPVLYEWARSRDELLKRIGTGLWPGADTGAT